MNNLITRTLTGIVFVTITILSILVSEWTLLALLLFFNISGQLEFTRLVKTDKSNPRLISSLIIGSLLVGLTFIYYKFSLDIKILYLLIVPISSVFIEELYLGKESPFRNISFSFLSVMYVSVPLTLSLTIVNNPVLFSLNTNTSFNTDVLLGIFMMLWIYDSMAYCIGVPFGKHRLFERISPKKSWEGTIGGAIFTIAASFFFYKFFPDTDTYIWVLLSIIVIVFGTFGDLVESMFKRSLNIKDSGNWLPGHGGILDRIDSFLFVIPWIWLVLVIVDFLK